MKVTLLNRGIRSSMRVDVGREDLIGDLEAVASDAWGQKLVLRNGYELLDPESSAGCVEEGAMLEVLPDPFGPMV